MIIYDKHVKINVRVYSYEKVRDVKINKKYVSMILISIMTLASMTGCATFEHFKTGFIDKPQENTATIQIGVYQPMTGSDSEAAELEIKGIELAHEMYPTINGKMIELVYADNISDIYAAETAIKELLVKEPSVILGSYGSVYSLVAGEYIKEAKIPAIAITNTNPLVTKNNKYYYRVCYVDSNQGDILARYLLTEKKEKTAGVLLPKEDDAAIAMATAFADRLKAETGNSDAIKVYEEYEAGAEDFSSQLDIIKKSGIKSVLLPGDTLDSANIIKQAKEMGLDVVFLGDYRWANYEFMKKTDGAASETNMAFVNFYSADAESTEEAEKFLKAYHEKYGQDSVPADSVALGYDAYVIALDAIHKAGDNVTGESLNKIFSGQYHFHGASGVITFSSTGDPIKTAYISTWKNGGVETLYTMDPNSEQPGKKKTDK